MAVEVKPIWSLPKNRRHVELPSDLEVSPSFITRNRSGGCFSGLGTEEGGSEPAYKRIVARTGGQWLMLACLLVVQALQDAVNSPNWTLVASGYSVRTCSLNFFQRFSTAVRRLGESNSSIHARRLSSEKSAVSMSSGKRANCRPFLTEI